MSASRYLRCGICVCDQTCLLLCGLCDVSVHFPDRVSNRVPVSVLCTEDSIYPRVLFGT